MMAALRSQHLTFPVINYAGQATFAENAGRIILASFQADAKNELSGYRLSVR